MSYRLQFTMKLPPRARVTLLSGFFALYRDETEVAVVRASSGEPGHQYAEHWWARQRSPIPPSDAVRGRYSLTLDWYRPGDTSSMGSRYYHITPDPIISRDGQRSRSEIGLHYDANHSSSPSSAGCIVALPLTESDAQAGRLDWRGFTLRLDRLRQEGLRHLPLEVVYSPLILAPSMDPEFAYRPMDVSDSAGNPETATVVYAGQGDDEAWGELQAQFHASHLAGLKPTAVMLDCLRGTARFRENLTAEYISGWAWELQNRLGCPRGLLLDDLDQLFEVHVALEGLGAPLDFVAFKDGHDGANSPLPVYRARKAKKRKAGDGALPQAAAPTLESLVRQGQSLPLTEVASHRTLVRQIQDYLRAIGLYPGGHFLNATFADWTIKAYRQFCTHQSLPAEPLDPRVAAALLGRPRLWVRRPFSEFVSQLNETRREHARRGYPGPLPFLDRGIKLSPLNSQRSEFEKRLTSSHAALNAVPWSDPRLNWRPYPARTAAPALTPGLSFLSGLNIAEACLGVFDLSTNPPQAVFLSHNGDRRTQWVSSTKFIQALYLLEQLEAHLPGSLVSNWSMRAPNHPTYTLEELLDGIVTYKGPIDSNKIAATLKALVGPAQVEGWLSRFTGQPGTLFRGGYGVPALPQARMLHAGSAPYGQNGTTGGGNSVSAYQMVRMLATTAWHTQLQQSSAVPANLARLNAALALDPARYLDVAWETLGVEALSQERVVLSKLGAGEVQATCVAAVRFVDRARAPHRLLDFALALRASGPGGERQWDANLAAGATEIVQRLLASEPLI